MCAGLAPELEKDSSFIGRWMDILRPGYDRVKDIKDEPERRRALEKETVLISLENLAAFPMVKESMDQGLLSLHGLWTDITEGGLEHYLPGEGFVPV